MIVWMPNLSMWIKRWGRAEETDEGGVGERETGRERERGRGGEGKGKREGERGM